MNFKILNRRTARSYKCDSPHLYISITDPGSEFVPLSDNKMRISKLKLKFDDIDTTVDYVDGREPLYFTVREADAILNFVSLHSSKVDTIICQCDAGISRSSAVAAALSVIYNGTGSDTWIFKQYQPNTLVYNKILKRNYELL